jgi:RimJ/RimL family protein N-acetyltransferase
MTRLVAEPLRSPRLTLEILAVAHAEEAAVALASPALHEFIGGAPSSAAELATRYRRLEEGGNVAGTQLWFNWMLRETASGRLVGTVQATVEPAATVRARLAWVVGVAHQRQGYAGEAAAAVMTWLRSAGVDTMEAFVHSGNSASMAIARSLGLRLTARVEDGEHLWTDAPADAPVVDHA